MKPTSNSMVAVCPVHCFLDQHIVRCVECLTHRLRLYCLGVVTVKMTGWSSPDLRLMFFTLSKNFLHHASLLVFQVSQGCIKNPGYHWSIPPQHPHHYHHSKSSCSLTSAGYQYLRFWGLHTTFQNALKCIPRQIEKLIFDPLGWLYNL